MSSARTQLTYLSTAPTTAPSSKLRRERVDRGGHVLPNQPPNAPYGSSTTTGALTGSTAHRINSSASNNPRLLSSQKERRSTKGEDFAAHDSEYVAFRAAKSIHQQQRPTAFQPRDDDGSASSSSASSDSSSSRFPSTPYTYQSTRASSNQYVPGLGKASAIPTHLSGKSRSTSLDYGSSLAPPTGSSSLRRISEQDRPSSSYRGPSSALKQPRQTIPSSHFTTSSFQPPAAFSSRLGGDPSSLRLPPKVSSATSSLAESTARMSLAEKDAGGSGYNQYASSRPDRLEGTTLDAGVHGMKRSWDGFKLEVKFGARRAKKSVERKVLNL